MAIAVAVALAVFALLLWGIILYNRLVTLENNVDRAWANVDVILKQRSDEVRNLEATVKGYAAHEKALIEHVARARATLGGNASVSDKAAADGELRQDLPRLIAVAESYPELKASESFLALQRRLSDLEDVLADRREFYNHSVVLFNTRIREIPDMWLAAQMRLQPKVYFRAEGDDRAAPALGPA